MLMSSLTASTAHHRGTPSHGHLQDRVRKPTSAAFHTPQSSVLPKGPVALWTGRCSRLGLGISTQLSPTPVAASIPSHPSCLPQRARSYCHSCSAASSGCRARILSRLLLCSFYRHFTKTSKGLKSKASEAIASKGGWLGV